MKKSRERFIFRYAELKKMDDKKKEKKKEKNK